MVGLWGVIGDRGADLDALTRAMPVGDAVVDTYRDDGVAVGVASHPQFAESQPATAGDGALVWLHGEVYGATRRDGYRPRDDVGGSTARYCTRLYDEVGASFAGQLNGEFVGLVYDPNDGSASLFTDRLGTVPLYTARVDGARLFATRLQAVGRHPSLSPRFDRDALAEFFGVQKAFGTTTPLAGVDQLPPATVTEVDADGAVAGRTTYWRPAYRPVDRSAGELATRFAETFQRVVAERTRADLEYGVLLSGGSDSRLLLGAAAAAGTEPTAYHMTNWRSRETRIAERVASVAGVPFETLRRGSDYHDRLLATVPDRSNFVGVFDEHMAAGFRDQLAGVDVVLTGYLGDTLFGTYPLYTRRSLRPWAPSVEHRIDTVDEYVRRYLERYLPSATVPAFLEAPPLEEVMTRNIHVDGGDLVHHGLRYPSLRALQLGEYYPLTNQFAQANSDSIRAITGHWSPFFDDRLLDLHLSVPVRDRLRHEPVDRAITRSFPGLAAIPHAWTGVPPAVDAHGHSGALRRTAAWGARRLGRNPPPAPFLSHGPWMDESELIRNRAFVGEAIERRRETIESLSFLDWDGVTRCYRAHRDGEDWWRALYALVTLLEAPVTRRVAGTADAATPIGRL